MTQTVSKPTKNPAILIDRRNHDLAGYSINRQTRPTRARTAEEKTAQVEFSLFAPYIKRAAVTGDFSQWKEIPMEKGQDGYFRHTVELPDGDYEYKFAVESNSPWQLGKWITVTDPTATDVNEMNSDNGVVHVRNGQVVLDEYQWQHDAAYLPPDNELVIYEMHVKDFGGNLKGVLEKLDYLSGLGVTAIELMPMAEFPGSISWGYNPKFFYALESAYGKTEDFKRLVDQCHTRGIRVILDLVANHGQSDTPLAQIDHNYWFHEHNTDAMQFGPKFDYNHWDDNYKLFPARKFMNEAAFYWATEFHLDGIRFDATALINNFDFLNWLGHHVKQAIGPKPFYLVAEQLPVDPAIVGVGAPMDGLWDDYFFFQMGATLRGGDFNGWQPYDWEKIKNALEPSRDGIIGPTAAVKYLSNHDQQRLMYELGTANIFEEAAFRKLKLGLGLLMTSVGVPMLWMGEEFGEYADKSMDPRPLHWELLKNETNADLYRFTSGLIYLRKTTGALKTEHIEFFHEDQENKVLAWKRWDEGGNLVVVVANLSDNALGNYDIEGFPDGDFHEYIYNYDVHAENNRLTDTLGRSNIKVYIKK